MCLSYRAEAFNILKLERIPKKKSWFDCGMFLKLWKFWSSRVKKTRTKQTDPPLCVVVQKIVPLNLHVCMPFSAHFYVLLTQFTLSLYFAVSLITNMLFSIHLMLVSATTQSFAQRISRDQWPMHSYAQLLSKLRPSPQNEGEVWGGGSAPFAGK